MKPILIAPLVAVVLAGAGVGAYYAVAGAGSGEEAPPAQPTATPTPTSAPTKTPAATAEPTPAQDDWVTYTDAQLGFKLLHPPGLSVNERLIDLPGKNDIPPTTQRNVSFVGTDGVPVVGISVTPNPAALTLEQWIRTVPGWPCDPKGYPTCVPSQVSVGGEDGIRFSINVLGEPAATVYFAHAGAIYALGGNVFGSPEGGFPPALSESDFQRVVAGFRFDD